MVRKATVHDVRTIQNILSYYVKQDILLPRSLADLYEHIRDFYVEESDEEDGNYLEYAA
jgi:amino-acid N-acetyltransferase